MVSLKSLREEIKFIFCVLLTQSISCELFCPPLKAPGSTRLTCKFPNDSQRINCSSSWLPDGTIARYKCLNERKELKRGRIRCKGQISIHQSYQENQDDNALPCGISEVRSAPEFHIYGYTNAKHYPIPSSLNTSANKDFRDFGIRLHNLFREAHGATGFKADQFLDSKAQKWAESLAEDGSLSLASEPNLGQNVFNSNFENKVEAINDAIQYWYNVGQSVYNWKDVKLNWNNPVALDFSQIVWKSTKKIGIGSSKAKNGTMIVVFYSPMGNVVLEDDAKPEKLFLENVLPSIQ